ncbi:hypothetical protein STTU_0841 [Streptomyces sp. Tu6071]|nr:hypothetical protein STTU_0841 [Streptomyces sp. Tu6071]
MQLQRTGKAAPGEPVAGRRPGSKMRSREENAAEGGSVPDVPGVSLQALLLGHLVLEREKQPHFLSFFPGGRSRKTTRLPVDRSDFPSAR